MADDLRQVDEFQQRIQQSLEEMDLDYEYPLGLDLHPRSALTKHIIEMVSNYAAAARAEFQKHESDYNEIDETLRAYMPADEWDDKVAALDPRKPTTIVLPMTFAHRETYLASMHSIYFRDGLIHPYRGVGSPRARIGGALLERVVARQGQWFNEELHLDTQWSDAFGYGRGLIALNWTKKKGANPRSEQASALLAQLLRDQHGIQVDEGDMLHYFDDVVLAEGTELQPIDLYQSLLDPNVAPNQFQKSAFVGWLYNTTPTRLLREETDPEEQMFNGKAVYYLVQQGQGRSTWWNYGNSRNHEDSIDQARGRETDQTLHVIRMMVDLVPKDHGLGSEDRPVKWLFEVAGDRVVIRCHPLKYYHGDYPAVLCAPNTDGHSVSPVSHLWITHGLQKFSNWLAKARMDAVLTVLNGMLFVDSSKVNLDDLMRPANGKFVRVNTSAFSAGGVESAVFPVPINDPTQGHLPDLAILDEIARHGNGASDIPQGQLGDMPERPGRLGIEMAAQGQMGRLARIARILWHQQMMPIAQQMAYNTQQFMGEEVTVPAWTTRQA